MVRVPMQTDPDFHKKMKEIQKKIMKNFGEFKGLPKIQREMIKMPEWIEIEQKLLKGGSKMELKIKMDSRKK